MPEHLQNIRGLFYSPTSENISGQMAVAAGLASPTELKLYSRKSRSKVNTENKHWLQASLKLWNGMDFKGQMLINHFQKVVDLYPDHRVVIYSSETHQPYPEGCFTGVNYDVEQASENTIFIFHDSQGNHFSWIQNMQRYYRSTNSHEDHHFCSKCLGWIRGSKINTHLCIYEFRLRGLQKRSICSRINATQRP